MIVNLKLHENLCVKRSTLFESYCARLNSKTVSPLSKMGCTSSTPKAAASTGSGSNAKVSTVTITLSPPFPRVFCSCRCLFRCGGAAQGPHRTEGAFAAACHPHAHRWEERLRVQAAGTASLCRVVGVWVEKRRVSASWCCEGVVCVLSPTSARCHVLQNRCFPALAVPVFVCPCVCVG